jgi:hypothetical protein
MIHRPLEKKLREGDKKFFILTGANCRSGWCSRVTLFTKYLKSNISASVVDPRHFGTDPVPYLVFSSMADKITTKNLIYKKKFLLLIIF